MTRALRIALTLGLDGLGIGLVVTGAWMVTPALGCLVGGVAALGVAAVATPPSQSVEPESEPESEQA